MKKIIVGLSLMLLIVTCIIGSVYAADCKLNLKTNKSEFDKNEEVVVDVDISGLTTQKGVAALMATLEYDTDSLTLVKIEGQNGWSSPNYNEANGKLIIDKNSNVTGTETILRITFKVKETAKQNLVVTIKNATVSGGTGDIGIARAYKEITIKSGTVNPKPDPGTDDKEQNTINNTITNTTTDNNQTTDKNQSSNIVNQIAGNNKNENTATGKLPQTGENSTLVMWIIVGAVLVMAIVLVGIRRINKKARR